MDSPKTRTTKRDHWFYGADAIDLEELNTVEFPLALLARQIPKEIRESKRLEFKDSITDDATGETLPRTLVISANADSELPNYWDQDALIALQVLTNRKQRWSSEVVEFTLYEVLKLMRLSDAGKNCQRLATSLDNWQGIRFKYSHWRKGGAWTHPKAFGIIQDYDLTRGAGRGRALPDTPQQFTWSRIFFESIQNQNTKPFDADFYFGLKSPSSRRFFRFSDKRLHSRQVYSKPIVEFATEKLGMTRGQKPSKYRQQLTPAYDELVSEKFLADLAPEKRFSRGRDGKTLYVNFRRGPGRKSRSRVSVPMQLVPAHEQGLIDRGCTPVKVRELVEDASVSKEHIELVLEWFDWRIETKIKMDNPGGWLYKSCKEGWQPPNDFKTKAQREAEAKAKDERRRREARAKAKEREALEERKRKEEEKREQFRTTRSEVEPAKQIELEDEALHGEQAFFRNAFLRDRREGHVGLYHQMLWEKKILPLLNSANA